MLTGTPATATSPAAAGGGGTERLSYGETALLAEVKTPPTLTSGRKLLEENTELTCIDENRFLMILDFQRRG